MSKQQSSIRATLLPTAAVLPRWQRVLTGMGMLASPSLLMAGPNGGTVIDGSADISAPDANTTQIDQHSNSAIINWQHFSVGSEEFVLFNQPSSSAVVLNRVIGGEMSEILGQMQANGRVFLVNPMGVLFGEGSRIDVGGLVASTQHISDADFSSGRYVFTGSGDAAVRNEGIIEANQGFVVLSAEQVQNSGLIQALGGNVLLASGGDLTLNIDGSGLVGYEIDAAAVSDKAGITNLGQIIADGGAVVLHADVARELAGTVINNEGQIRAQGINEGPGGDIYLTANGGDIRHAGSIDVSGSTGGTARLIASDHLETTESSRTLSHGADRQSGGFIELSGHGSIRVRGEVAAPGGLFQLDPADVTIGNGDSRGSCTANFCEIDLEDALRGGTNVQIVASNSITLQDLSDNTLDGRNNGTGGSLTLGIGSVSDGAFIVGPNGSITFDSNQDAIRVDGSLKLQAGSSAGSINVGILSGGSVDLDAAGNITATNLLGHTGSIDVDAGGNVSIAGANTSNAVDRFNGSVSITAGGSILVSGAIDTQTLSNSERDRARVNLQAGTTVQVGDIHTHAYSTPSEGGGTARGDVTINAGGSVTTGQITTNAFGSASYFQTGGTAEAQVSITSTGGTISTGSISTTARYSGSSYGGSSIMTNSASADARVALTASTNNVVASGAITTVAEVREADHESAVAGVTVSSGGTLTLQGIKTRYLGSDGSPSTPSNGDIVLTASGQLGVNGKVDVLRGSSESAGGFGSFDARTVSGDLQVTDTITATTAELRAGTSTGSPSGSVQAGNLSVSNLTAEAVDDLQLGNFNVNNPNLSFGGNLTLGNVTTQSDLVFNLGGTRNIDVGDLTTTGKVDLRTTGGTLAAQSITAGQNIIVNAGTGDLTLGALSAANGIKLDTTNGSLILTSANADSDGNNTGTLDIDVRGTGADTQPASIIATGTLTGEAVELNAAGDIDLAAVNSAIHVRVTAGGDISATDDWTAGSAEFGNEIDVYSTGGGSVTLQKLTSGDIFIGDINPGQNTGNISLGTLEATDGVVVISSQGNINIAEISSSAAPNFVIVDAVTGNLSFTNKDISSTISINLETQSGPLQLGTLTAGQDIFIDNAGGAVQLLAATADLNKSGDGKLTVTASGDLTASGNLAGQSALLRGLNVGLANVTTASNVDIQGLNIIAGNVTGGAAVTNHVDVRSLGATAGTISLGNVAGGDIRIGDPIFSDNTGDITTGTLTASDTIEVESSSGNISITGINSAPGFIDLNAQSGSLTVGGNLTSTGSYVSLNAGSGDLNLGALSAASFINIDTTNGSLSLTSANADSNSDNNGTLDFDIRGTGADTLPASITSTGTLTGNLVELDAAGDIDLAAVNSANYVRITAGGSISATDNWTAGSAAAFNEIDVQSTGSGNITLKDLSGGDIYIGDINAGQSTGNISLGTLTAADAVIVETSNGNINITGIGTTAGFIDLNAETGSLTVGGNLTSTGSSISLHAAAGDLNLMALSAANGIEIDTGNGSLSLSSASADSDSNNSGSLDMDVSGTGADNLPASITATGTLAGNFLEIDAAGDIDLAALNSANYVRITAGGNISATDNWTAGSAADFDEIDVQSIGGGNINLKDLSAGDIFIGDINAGQSTGDITLGKLSATDGVVVRSSVGNISIAEASGTAIPNFITIDATAGSLSFTNKDISATSSLRLQAQAGSLELGTLTAGTDITLDNAGGNIQLTAATADFDKSGTGKLNITASGDLTATGNVAGQSALLRGLNVGLANVTAVSNVDIQGLNITAGNVIGGAAASQYVDVRSLGATAGSITLGNVSGGDIRIGDPIFGDNTSDITTGILTASDTIDVESSQGNISIAGISGSTVPNSISVDAVSGSLSFTNKDISSAGSMTLNAQSGPLQLGTLNAGKDINVDNAGGSIQLVAASADSDNSGDGNLTITASGNLTSSSNIAGQNVLLRGLNVGLANVSAASNVDIQGLNITAGNVTGGAAATNDVDVRSLGATAGTITLGNVSGGDIRIGDPIFGDNTSDITTGILTASDTIDVESSQGNISIAGISGSTVPNSIAVDAVSGSLSFTNKDLTSAGSMDLNAHNGALQLGTLTAGRDIRIDNTNGTIQLAAATADFDKSGDGNLFINSNADLTASGNVAGQNVFLRGLNVGLADVSAASNVDIQGLNITAGNVTGGAAVSNDVDVRSLGATAGSITLGNVSGGDIRIGDPIFGDNTSDITTGILTASDTIDVESSQGNISIAGISGSTVPNSISVDAVSGSLSFTDKDITSAGSISLNAQNGALQLGTLNAGKDINVDNAGGTIQLVAATADFDQNGDGNLNITASGDLTASGNVGGQSAFLRGQNVGLNNVSASSNVDIHGVNVSAGNITGGAGVTNHVDVRSLGVTAGTISLGNVSGGDIRIGDPIFSDNTGDITTGTLTASDTIDVESNLGNIAVAGAQAASRLELNARTRTIDLSGSVSAPTLVLTASTISSATAVNLHQTAGALHLDADIIGPMVQIRSADSLTIRGNINAGSTGSVQLRSDNAGISTAGINSQNLAMQAMALDLSDFNLSGLLDLDAFNGNISLGNVSAGTVELNASGNIGFSSLISSGNQTINSGQNIAGGVISGAQVNASALVDVSLSGANATGGDLRLSGNNISSSNALNATGLVVLTPVGGTNTADITGNGGIQIGNANTLGNIDTGALSSSNGGINLQTGGNIRIGGAQAATSVRLSAQSQLLTLTGSVTAPLLEINAASISSPTDVTLHQTAGALVLNSSVNAPLVQIRSADALSISGNIDAGATGSVQLRSDNAGITTAGIGTQSLQVTGTQLNVGAVSASGNVSLQATDDVSLARANAGAIEINAGASLSAGELNADGDVQLLAASLTTGIITTSGVLQANTSSGTLSIGGASASSMRLQSAGDMQLAGSVLNASAGAVNLAATAGTINLDSAAVSATSAIDAQAGTPGDSGYDLTVRAASLSAPEIDLRASGNVINLGSTIRGTNYRVTANRIQMPESDVLVSGIADYRAAETLNLDNASVQAAGLSLTAGTGVSAENAVLTGTSQLDLVSGGRVTAGSLNGGSISLSTPALLEAESISGSNLSINAGSADLGIVTSSGVATLQTTGELSALALISGSSLSASSGTNFQLGTLQSSGTVNLSAVENFTAAALRAGTGNLEVFAGNSLRLIAGQAPVLLQAGSANLAGINSVLLQGGSVSANTLNIASSGIVALDGLNLTANAMLVQVNDTAIQQTSTKSDSKANEGLLQIRGSTMNVSGLLQLEADSRIESLTNSSQIQAGALAVRAGGAVDLRTANLQVGSEAAPFGGDANLLSQLSARGVSGLPASTSPNAVIQAGDAIALGNLRMTGRYLSLRSNSMTFAGNISSSNPLFVNLRPSANGGIQIENQEFQSTGLGLTAAQLAKFGNPVFAFGGSDYSGAVVVGSNGPVNLSATQSSFLFLSQDRVVGSDQIRTGGRVVAVSPVVITTSSTSAPPQTEEFKPNPEKQTLDNASAENEEDDEQDQDGRNQSAQSNRQQQTIEEETSGNLALECS